MRRLSATSLETYLRCPQQWKLKYVDGLEEAPKPFFNLGSAVHAALETMFDRRVAEPAPLEEVLESFREEFDSDAYPTEEERERRRADGLRMVREFWEKHAGGDFRPPLAVEKRLDFEVEGVPFVGFVDRIDKVDDDHVRVVDYKTGGRRGGSTTRRSGRSSSPRGSGIGCWSSGPTGGRRPPSRTTPRSRRTSGSGCGRSPGRR